MRKKQNRRFIVNINHQDGTFEIDTPDGYIDYNILLDTIRTILDILLEEESDQPEQQEKKPRSKKELN